MDHSDELIALAIHEASHAIVAVHLKVKVSYVTISVNDGGFWGSGVSGFASCTWSRRQAEHAITVGAAGAEAERHFLGKRTVSGDGGDGGDRCLIAEIAKNSSIPKSRVRLLRRRTARLMHTWYIQVAIARLANELLDRDTIPGARVKYIYRKARSRRSRVVPVAALQPPKDWMFDWMPKTFEKDLQRHFGETP
jgi:hypothetical protein